MGFRLVTRVGASTDDPSELAALAEGFLRGVITGNRLFLRKRRLRGKPVPPLYRSGVRYEPEPWDGIEEFADIRTVLGRGWGDCDDLVAWRCAELQEKGINATVRIYWRLRKSGGRQVYKMHAQLRHPRGCRCRTCRAVAPEVRARGRIEDPSRYLGL
jgi:hypothetical protein